MNAKTCNGKACYPSKNVVELYKRGRLHSAKKIKLHVYLCPECYYWHLSQFKGRRY